MLLYNVVSEKDLKLRQVMGVEMGVLGVCVWQVMGVLCGSMCVSVKWCEVGVLDGVCVSV